MTSHIVIIEDDPALQEFYRLFLEGEGYKITISPPFDLSTSLVAALHPDLIILDLLIGGKPSGLPFLQSLNSVPQTVALPVLLVTALPLTTFEEEWKKFTNRQNVSVVIKPFDIDTLLATIRSLLLGASPSIPETVYNDPI